jgi:hypothetical protein
MDSEYDVFDEFLIDNQCGEFEKPSEVEPFFNSNAEYDEEFLRSLNDDLLVFLPQSMKNDECHKQPSKESMEMDVAENIADEWPNVDKLLQCGMFAYTISRTVNFSIKSC